jgi:two-component sensor histidine kinase
MRELTHRSKNLLTVIQSMARQAIAKADNLADLETAFDARLRALADTHDLLVTGSWRSTDFRELVRAQLSPFRKLDDPQVLAGPTLRLNAKATELIGMALYELGTNAAKYGAFSGHGGTVSLEWTADPGPNGGNLRIRWIERGGPAVRPPQRNGFGHLVITSIVPTTLQGSASIDYDGDGVCWTIVTPSQNLLAEGETATAVKPGRVVL